MTINSLRIRLEKGKCVDHVYQRDGMTGLIAIWKHDDAFILTWEECPEGEQYDEAKYTRDERHEFSAPESAVEFLREQSFDLVSW